MVVAMARSISNLSDAQRAARIVGEKQDVRNILRGSVSCATKCDDVLRDIPPQVGEWALAASCENGKITVKMRNPTVRGDWAPVYGPGMEEAICAKIEPAPGTKVEPGRGRQMCDRGKKLQKIDFATESIVCE